jgi:hypothetical protein
VKEEKMRTFNLETAAAALDLEQMVADWCRDLDVNGGLNSTDFFTEDCIVEAGRISYKGHAAMQKFYQDRAERVRAEQKDGVRTARHVFTNLRFLFEGNDRVTLTFLIINFSGSGKAPLFDATVPSVVSDVRFECRRDAKGQWRIAEFHGAPIFVGNDPFLIKAVVTG